ALMGLFAARYYRSRLAFVGLPFRPHVVAVVGLFLVTEAGLALWDLFHGAAAGGVANWAHVGGFIFGLACAQAMRLPEAGRRAYLRADAAQAMDKSMPGSAIKRWEMLLAREPANPAAHVELARAWLLLGDSDLASRHFVSALRLYLQDNRRSQAARLYQEVRQAGLPTTGPLRPGVSSDLALTPTELMAIGSALEENKQYADAAETLQMLAARFPDATEADTALIKAVHLYIQHLARPEEGRLLLRLFAERYPLSPLRSLAAELEKRIAAISS
ncbi:MAG TPA: rhomboid family intramembrane serine protease, partial [Chthonomonadaceae bacterium]|nr:rhomboid family intramembrane serine protease [Chthonomonadaceae bacterium]